jgi:hypothetical protein
VVRPLQVERLRGQLRHLLTDANSGEVIGAAGGKPPPDRENRRQTESGPC